MAYDPNSIFQQQYSEAQSSGDPGIARDQAAAMQQMQLLQMRAQLDAQQKEKDFQNQLLLLRQSAEYNNASTKQRTALEAQLYAMKEGMLSPEKAQELVQTGQMSPEQAQAAMTKQQSGGNGGIDWTEALGMAGGGEAGRRLGNKYMKGGINAGLKGAGKIGDIMSQGNASSYLKNAGMANEMYGNRMYGKLDGITKGTLRGMPRKQAQANIEQLLKYKGTALGGKGMSMAGAALGKSGAEKGLGKGLAKLGTKALPKILGAGGGVPGLILGTVAGELLDDMIFGEDSKKQYMNQMYGY